MRRYIVFVNTSGNRVGRILSFLIFPLLIISTLVVVIVYKEPLWQVFSSSENIQRTVESWGAAAPLAFIGLQFVQVVIFIIPGEVPQIAGGYLFGMAKGTLYSIVGILLGSSFNFLLARLFGIPFVKALFKEEQLSKFDNITHSSRAQIAFFLLFVIPGIPKDVLCYVAGLSPLRFVAFITISTIGRLPGILGSAAMGNAAASSKWLLAGSILVVATILFVLGLMYRDKIHGIIERVAMRKPSDPEDANTEG